MRGLDDRRPDYVVDPARDVTGVLQRALHCAGVELHLAAAEPGGVRLSRVNQAEIVQGAELLFREHAGDEFKVLRRHRRRAGGRTADVAASTAIGPIALWISLSMKAAAAPAEGLNVVGRQLAAEAVK